MFLPRLQSLETIRRPVDRAAAVPIETAYMKVRIRKNLHAEMCLDFIFYITLGTSFWTSRFLFVDDPAARLQGSRTENLHNCF